MIGKCEQCGAQNRLLMPIQHDISLSRREQEYEMFYVCVDQERCRRRAMRSMYEMTNIEK